MPRIAADTRSTGSVSRPNLAQEARASITPTPPRPPSRRTTSGSGRGPVARDIVTGRPLTDTTRTPALGGTRDARKAGRKVAKAGRSASPSPRGVDQKATDKVGQRGKKPSGPVVRNFPLHPEHLPVGLHGGEQLRLGFIRRVPQFGDDKPYAFHFLYNPPKIAIQTGLNVDVTFDPQDIGPNFASGAQTISFDIFLNRMMDMTLTGAVRGGQVLNRLQLADLRRYGTLHDLRYLYHCCNGPAQNLYSNSDSSGASSSFTDKTPDVGFLYSSPVEVHFGADLRFAGIINSIGVEHKLFNKGMVPIYSEVAISLTRIAGTGVKVPTTTTTTEPA